MRQAEALAILQSGASVFLTGAPGAGKTYVLNEFVRQARAEGAAVSVTASTGIAATHINGQTIHSWSGVGLANALTDNLIKTIRTRRKRKLQALTFSSSMRFPCCMRGCSTWSIRCAALFDVTNARSEGFKWCCPAISSSFRQ